MRPRLPVELRSFQRLAPSSPRTQKEDEHMEWTCLAKEGRLNESTSQAEEGNFLEGTGLVKEDEEKGAHQ